MPIEWGRFLGTVRDIRICELCSLHRLGDEYHYLLECTYFEDLRKVYLPRNVFTRPNTVKFKHLMNSSNTDTHLLFNIANVVK